MITLVLIVLGSLSLLETSKYSHILILGLRVILVSAGAIVNKGKNQGKVRIGRQRGDKGSKAQGQNEEAFSMFHFPEP